MKRIKKIGALCFICILLFSSFGMFFGGGNKVYSAKADGQNNTNSIQATAEKTESGLITSLEQLNGKRIGCLQGTSYIQAVEENFTDCKISEYKSYADLITALKSGRIDAYITDEPMMYSQIKEAGGITAIEEMITTDRYGFMLNFDNAALCEAVNEEIAVLKSEGFLDELKKKWITSKEKPTFDTSQKWEKPNGVLKVGLSLESKPFAYLQDQATVGYDVELLYKIAERLGYGLSITNYDFSAIIGGIASGRDDIAIGCITYTAERAESVLFTDTTYNSGTVAIVLGNAPAAKGFFEGLGDSFYKTFIKENRWIVVVNGLFVTIQLAFFTLVFGTLAGFGFSFLLRSKNKAVAKIAEGISIVINCLPLLIILMVLYYLVFVETALSAVTIGVIGLSLDFANTVAGTLNTGVAGVDKGQIEAAESMGYPKGKAFMKIIFPQAMNQMFSQYTSSVVNMIKSTSIMGYITIVDLTKAGDIIRSLTYEAFFPLLSIALVYFLLSQAMIALFKWIAKRINPKYRKREIKGVIIDD